VLITGPLYGEDKLEAYVDADIYVLPSRYETFPMGLLEAYACGKPVIASKIGGLKNLVINEVTGLLFEPGNVEQLANSMLLLLNDQNKAEKIGLRGKRFVKENFTIEKAVDKLESLYEKLFQVSIYLLGKSIKKIQAINREVVIILAGERSWSCSL